MDQVVLAAAAAPQAADGLQERVREALEQLRPYLRADGGDCELLGIEGDVVTVRMSGACVGCQLAGATLNGLGERLSAAVGTRLRIVAPPRGR